MRGAWLCDPRDAEEFLAAARTQGKQFDIEIHHPGEVYVPPLMHSILKCDFVILPLSLPGFASLWFVELANKLGSPARLILLSRTDADPVALDQLFDGFCKPEGGFSTAFDAIERESKRKREASETGRLIMRIVETSYHYQQLCHGRLPSLSEVRARPEPEGISSSPPALTTIEPPPPQVRIVFFASNPTTTSPLDLEEEIRMLEQELREVRHRERIRVGVAHAARPDDLLRFVRATAPTIVHFSGHGMSRGIVLRNDNGDPMVVQGRALARLFKDRGVSLVVFNCCYSKRQAAAVGKVVPSVIGTTNAVNDQAARRFTAAFYRTLGNGLSIREAFRDGGDAVALHGFDDVFRAQGDMDRQFFG